MSALMLLKLAGLKRVPLPPRELSRWWPPPAPLALQARPSRSPLTALPIVSVSEGDARGPWWGVQASAAAAVSRAPGPSAAVRSGA